MAVPRMQYAVDRVSWPLSRVKEASMQIVLGLDCERSFSIQGSHRNCTTGFLPVIDEVIVSMNPFKNLQCNSDEHILQHAQTSLDENACHRLVTNTVTGSWTVGNRMGGNYIAPR